MIENNKHTITVVKHFNPMHVTCYKVLEYCNIIEQKEEVKHPDYKMKILDLYNLKYK